MNNYKVTYETRNGSGIYSAAIVKAETAEQAAKWFNEYKGISGADAAELREPVKPGQSVLTVPADYESHKDKEPVRNKKETQNAIAEQLKALSRIEKTLKSGELTPEKHDRESVKRFIVLDSISRIIEDCFRGEQPEQSTQFEIMPELDSILQPYYKKSIGESRRAAIGRVISEFLTPEAVNGYKIKCYLSLDTYAERLCFYYTFNGFTNGAASHLFDIYIRDNDPAQPFNLVDGCRTKYSGQVEKVKTCYRHAAEVTPATKLNKKAGQIITKQKQAKKKIKKLIAQINAEIEKSRAGVPHDAQIGYKPLYEGDFKNRNNIYKSF